MSSTIQFKSEQSNIKELPHNIEAEQGLLGAILINNDIIYDVLDILNDTHFYEPAHRLIFNVILKITSKGQLATPITLKSYFEVEKNLEEIGGSNYLARLANSAVSLDFAKNYAQIIYDLSIRRGLYQLGGKVQYDAIESEINIGPNELIENAERELYQISEKGMGAGGVQTFTTAVDEAIELARKYDSEFPEDDFEEVLEYLDMNNDQFEEIVNKHRNQEIWKSGINNKWKLINSIWKKNDKRSKIDKHGLCLNEYENNFNNEDSIIISRTFLQKLKKIKILCKDYAENKDLNKTISNAKPPIFWKDKEIVKSQIEKWKINQINQLIIEINEIEFRIKRNYENAMNIVLDFILEKSSI